jgi:hypothetical protein
MMCATREADGLLLSLAGGVSGGLTKLSGGVVVVLLFIFGDILRRKLKTTDVM